MGVALKYKSETPVIYARVLNEPLFHGEESAVVLDVDGVLMRQLPNFHKGERGADTYCVYDGAVNFLYRLQSRVGEKNVVLWSSCQNYIDFFDGKLFRNIRHHVIGLCEMDFGGLPVLCKDLHRVHRKTSRLVAVEDAVTESECCFFPTGRVVRVPPKKARQDYSYLFQQIKDMF